MCKHGQLTEQIKLLGARKWCVGCSSWVYKSDIEEIEKLNALLNRLEQFTEE